jgi:hypothetical protein
MWKNKLLKKYGKWIIFALSLTFALCLAEISVRLLMKDRITIFPRYHTDANYGEFTIRRLRPNTTFWHTSIDGTWKFTTNSKGFRNYQDFTYDKKLEGLRILSIGDSHTQGFEVRQEATFSAIIANYLTGHNIETEVINAGISGFSTAEALVFLENEGVRYSPDVVVLGFYANDFDDNIKSGLFGLEYGGLVL